MTVTTHNCNSPKQTAPIFKTDPISSLRVHHGLRAMILLVGFGIKPSSQGDSVLDESNFVGLEQTKKM
jgi:hypothetical protein